MDKILQFCNFHNYGFIANFTKLTDQLIVNFS